MKVETTDASGYRRHEGFRASLSRPIEYSATAREKAAENVPHRTENALLLLLLLASLTRLAHRRTAAARQSGQPEVRIAGAVRAELSADTPQARQESLVVANAL